MSIWTALVVIVAILALVRIRIEKYRVLGRAADGEPGEAGAERERLEREVAGLKQRIAVLERIVTDDRRSREVADQIEALRDR